MKIYRIVNDSINLVSFRDRREQYKDYLDIGHGMTKSPVIMWIISGDGEFLKKTLIGEEITTITHSMVFPRILEKALATGRYDIKEKVTSAILERSYYDGLSDNSIGNRKRFVESVLRENLGNNIDIEWFN